MQEIMSETKTVLISAPADYNASAATTEWLNMQNYRRCKFTILTGAWAGGTAAVTVKEATNTSGSSSASLAFANYYTNDGAPTTDTMTKTACSSTFNLDTASAVYEVDIDAKSLTNPKGCIAIAVGICSGSNSDFYSISATLYNPRFAQATPPTAQ